MLYRQLYQWSEPRTLQCQLNVSLIRPHLEYAAPVWDFYLSKDIHEIEVAQKFALKVAISERLDSSYDNLLEESDLVELNVQRNHLSLCHLYRIIQELCVHLDALLSLYHNSYHTCFQDINRYERLQAHTQLQHVCTWVHEE